MTNQHEDIAAPAKRLLPAPIWKLVSFVDHTSASFRVYPKTHGQECTSNPLMETTRNGLLGGITTKGNGETSRDCWVIHLILTKIDTESRRKWIGDTRYSVSPAVNDLLNFLDVPGKIFYIGSDSHSSRSAHLSQLILAIAVTSTVQRSSISELKHRSRTRPSKWKVILYQLAIDLHNVNRSIRARIAVSDITLSYILKIRMDNE